MNFGSTRNPDSALLQDLNVVLDFVVHISTCCVVAKWAQGLKEINHIPFLEAVFNQIPLESIYLIALAKTSLLCFCLAALFDSSGGNTSMLTCCELP